MIPGLGGMNPKKMQGLMRQLGMEQEEVEAERVVIEKSDGKIVIKNPQVVKITMQGQSSFQISGEIVEMEEGFSDEDVKMIMEKTGKTEKEVKKVLEEKGDIAEAIVALSE